MKRKRKTKHRITIPCKWSFVVKSGAFHMLFMHFSYAFHALFMCFSLTLSGFSHCVNPKYELLRDHQVLVFLSKDQPERSIAEFTADFVMDFTAIHRISYLPQNLSLSIGLSYEMKDQKERKNKTNMSKEMRMKEK